MLPRRLVAGVLALALSVLPSAAVLCCAWSVSDQAAAAAPSCHHVEPAATPTAALQAASHCAPHAPSVVAQTEVLRTLLPALDAPAWEQAPQAANRTQAAATDPVPIRHVPIHLLHAVLLI